MEVFKTELQLVVIQSLGAPAKLTALQAAFATATTPDVCVPKTLSGFIE